MKKTIGIVGGMGPLATCDLFKKIVEITDAACDQDHVRVCIDSNTEISDRTAAILSGGKNPVPEMVKSAVRLQGMGADVLIMPCNTAHYFYNQIVPFVDTPFLNMLEETAKEIKRRGIKKVGLLATDGTCQSGVYKTVFDAAGIEMLSPSPVGQQAVMDVIYKGVKAGNLSIDLSGFNKAMDELFEAGAEVLVLGCTELPVAFELFHIDRPNIDPTLVLAAAAVRFVGAKVKEEVGY
ncbi:aspartate/glutamate racemase family protein [Fusibacillus kribbianus]|uniref:Amino acid racemase n=1 Tax=Fusibacillus kribbianus TaxID=3044208 RepID=A0AAP4BB53_9FIRM|nr:amino acid racemase [Ruminococcus sp. YH-rum2234]MDI9242765.1 amino acid racemase [Ruminococcus sp. YH-rum2234]